MVDRISPEQRSDLMSRIRGTNTQPELQIRHALFRRGYRYRLHRRDLPGNPDLVFPKFQAVIFVHGCFWHKHNCKLFRMPKTRTDYWSAKFEQNQLRDRKFSSALREQGWRCLTIWECALRGTNSIGVDRICDQVESWLNSEDTLMEIQGASSTG